MNRFVAFALVLASTAAHAEPKLAALTKAWADKHGMPVRIVKSDLGTRQVERHFVPVLPTTHEDFFATFSKEHGAVVFKTKASDKVHGALSMGPGDMLSHGGRNNDVYTAMPHEPGATYLAMALDKPHLDAWMAFVDKHTPNGVAPFLGGYNDGLGHFTAEMAALNQPVHGGCMWWVMHADIGDGKNLAHLMGVRRAKGPEILAPRLIHAGNELVGPIGIGVATLEEFNAMTDQQLLGPEPAGGAAEQVKE